MPYPPHIPLAWPPIPGTARACSSQESTPSAGRATPALGLLLHPGGGPVGACLTWLCVQSNVRGPWGTPSPGDPQCDQSVMRAHLGMASFLSHAPLPLTADS